MGKNYEVYESQQFLDDPFFIEWIKHRTLRTEAFWNSWIRNNPPNLKAMREAEAQLNAFLSAQRIDIEEDETKQVWERIQHSLASTFLPDAGRKTTSKLRPMLRTWWAAAAILLVLATGSYVLWRQGSGRVVATINQKQQPFQNDIAPGGNKAILTLSDGTKVVLDTANNGALTKQGDVTVIKLDGQLAYNKEGSTAKEVLYNTITTPKGGQYQLVLADGTRVWLNAASSLRYPTSFTGSERRVEITGEAYFEVAKNAAMPFKIKVDGKGEVEVLGTHFNINAYRDEQAISTTLLEGSIRFTDLENMKAAIIIPGQQVLMGIDGQLKLNKNPDLESVIGWKNGSFHFNSQDIKSIMRQISRWYDVDVVYSGETSGETFSGIVSRKSNISEVLNLMEDSGVKFKIEGKRIIVQF
jgi:ferric-dicitrate binding protein FerR (iron transport regulator)